MMILPEIENVITHMLTDMEDEAPYIGITEKPSTGYGERIFNIYDYRTQRDIARFDVRRDNRPQDGYWFNFHYHLGDDNFEKHYEIGEIYRSEERRVGKESKSGRATSQHRQKSHHIIIGNMHIVRMTRAMLRTVSL